MKSFSTLAATLVVVGTTYASPVQLRTVHPQPNLVWHNGTVAPTPQADQMCINFENSIDTWYYTLQGPWGSASGQSGSSGSICVPTSNTGGAMFIGPDANPGPGSTKLECQFPDSGNANCDVSLVDGYSSSVFCEADGAPTNMGGSVELYQTGIPCPDQQGPNCINTNGYAGSQSDVDAFFQPAVENYNQYCIWVDCTQDFYFPVANTLNCAVLS